MRKAYFPDCLTGFLCWHRVWTGGKGNYLYIISLAAFYVLLIKIIVNEVHEKGSKWVKFYLNFWIIGIFIKFHVDPVSRFPLWGTLDGFGFGTGWLCRFICGFPLLEGIITLFIHKQKVYKLNNLKISKIKRKHSAYNRRFILSVEGVQAGLATGWFRFIQNFLDAFSDLFIGYLNVDVALGVF